ncbi:MAG: tetratricopeptide repeat protein [Chloroflexota bacterium]|nr:tetratricopeptide repeat protein [Chloroflexota bacterium]
MRPSGTITFLFSDIEASTRLLQQLGADRYGGALEEHRDLMRAALAARGGEEVDTQGDAFFMAFSRAQDAVAAAVDAQRALAEHDWPDGTALRVRMGLHTTEAVSTADGYVGIGVHRGARICAAAHGGQVLLSQTTANLLEDEGASQLVVDLGPHRLKDLAQPQRLFQLSTPGLDVRFPPLRTLDNHPTNLPIQPTALIGRDRELTEIKELLPRDEVRLVTLTGTGGMGKTRLALQVAAELVESFADGVYLVSLAAITDPELVEPAIAQALGISESAGQELPAYLAERRLLLVLDNLEQVMGATPRLMALLDAAPRLKLLITSQEPLHVMAEHLYPVHPLGLPDLAHLPDGVAALARHEAVALFLERAQALNPRFGLTDANAPAVAEICVRLDGLPLAIELAAARTPLLSPEAMLKRLGERFKLLSSPTHDRPARHQTLRDTLAWSHELLTDKERRLFASLAVFAGGFSLDAGEVVAEADLDALGALVDRGLVRRDGDRYQLLETIRAFALEQLAAAEDEEAIRARHAAFFSALAEAAYAERLTNGTDRADELEREHDNLRAVLDWLGPRDPRAVLRLAAALGWFWHVHSKFTEGRARMADALAATDGRDADRARALSAAGELAAWQGDVDAARPLLDGAISIWRELGGEQQIALALHDLGWGYFYAGKIAESRRAMEESLDLQRSIGDPVLVNRAQLGLLQVLVAVGDVETVRRLGPEALALSQRLGDLWSEHFAHHFLADCAVIEGDCVTAQQHYARSLDAAWRSGDEVETSFEVQGIAMAAAGLGHSDRALRLAACAAERQRHLGLPQLPHFWTALVERYLEMARAALGPEASGAAWEAGRRMDFGDAVAEAAIPETGALPAT